MNADDDCSARMYIRPRSGLRKWWKWSFLCHDHFTTTKALINIFLLSVKNKDPQCMNWHQFFTHQVFHCHAVLSCDVTGLVPRVAGKRALSLRPRQGDPGRAWSPSSGGKQSVAFGDNCHQRSWWQNRGQGPNDRNWKHGRSAAALKTELFWKVIEALEEVSQAINKAALS